jgi:hypothetical protein
MESLTKSPLTRCRGSEIISEPNDAVLIASKNENENDSHLEQNVTVTKGKTQQKLTYFSLKTVYSSNGSITYNDVHARTPISLVSCCTLESTI